MHGLSQTWPGFAAYSSIRQEFASDEYTNLAAGTILILTYKEWVLLIGDSWMLTKLQTLNLILDTKLWPVFLKRPS